jgi:uncharacterized protein YukJ
MPLNQYGVLAGRAADARREDGDDTPHYQILLVDSDATSWRLAVNVESSQAPSELLYLVEDDLHHPVTDVLAALSSGWHLLTPRAAGGPNIDFVRSNIVDRARMRLLPPSAAGPDNDLADLLDHYVQRAIADPAAVVYALGQRFGPEPSVPDKVFRFKPGNGVHDIHMNQGNAGSFRKDNGVFQDGALILHFPAQSRWVGIFLAFQSQAWHTDDRTGDALGGQQPAPVKPDTPPRPSEPPAPPPAPAADGVVQIVAAMVNPVGPAPEAESVLLLNVSPQPVDLSGWKIADKVKRTCPVPPGPLAAGATLRVAISNGVALGNSGGIVTLLDSAGLKVSGVAYTAGQGGREGWTVTF